MCHPFEAIEAIQQCRARVNEAHDALEKSTEYDLYISQNAPSDLVLPEAVGHPDIAAKLPPYRELARMCVDKSRDTFQTEKRKLVHDARQRIKRSGCGALTVLIPE